MNRKAATSTAEEVIVSVDGVNPIDEVSATNPKSGNVSSKPKWATKKKNPTISKAVKRDDAIVTHPTTHPGGSKLTIADGFGTPSGFLYPNRHKYGPIVPETSPVGWATQEAIAWRTDMQRKLLGDGLFSLGGLLPSLPLHLDPKTWHIGQIDIIYQVEPPNDDATRAHQRKLTTSYRISRNHHATNLIYAKGQRTEAYITNRAKVNDVQSNLSSRVNGWLMDGINYKQLSAQAAHKGPDLVGLFTVGWLIALDLVAGGEITLVPRNGAIRVPVTGVTPALADQINLVRHLQGVRAHRDGMTVLMHAFLSAATRRDSMTGGTRWLSRFEWPEVPFVVYGSHAAAPPPLQLSYDDRNAFESMLLAFAQNFGALNDLKIGLHTAVFLYGLKTLPREMHLICNQPNLFQEVSVSSIQDAAPKSLGLLTNRNLLNLSWFLSSANNQYARDLLHTTGMTRLHADDNSRMCGLLRETDVHARDEAAVLYGAGVHEAGPVMVDYILFFKHALHELWSSQGVLEQVFLGRIVAGSVTHECVVPHTGPSPNELQRTDMLTDSRAHAKAQRTAILLTELLVRGGSGLGPSMNQFVRSNTGRYVISPDLHYYAKREVQLMVVAFSQQDEIMVQKPEYIQVTSLAPLAAVEEAEEVGEEQSDFGGSDGSDEDDVDEVIQQIFNQSTQRVTKTGFSREHRNVTETGIKVRSLRIVQSGDREASGALSQLASNQAEYRVGKMAGGMGGAAMAIARSYNALIDVAPTNESSVVTSMLNGLSAEGAAAARQSLQNTDHEALGSMHVGEEAVISVAKELNTRILVVAEDDDHEWIAHVFNEAADNLITVVVRGDNTWGPFIPGGNEVMFTLPGANPNRRAFGGGGFKSRMSSSSSIHGPTNTVKRKAH